MARKKAVEPTAFQLACEKTLRISALALGFFHMLISLMRYCFDYYRLARPIECWFAVALAISATFYFLYNWLYMPETMYRVRELFRRMWSPELLFVIGLVAWYPICCLINQLHFNQPIFRANDWLMFDTAVNAVILFPLAIFLPGKKARAVVDAMLHVIMLFATAVAVYSLWNLFHLNVVTMPSGYQIGMTSDLQFTIGLHYNITGATAATMMCVSIYMIASQKPALRLIYLPVMLIHAVVLLLTNSRASFVAGLVAVVAASFLACEKLFTGRRLQRMAISTIAAILCGVLFWFLRAWVFVLFDKVTHFKELVSFDELSDVRKLDSLNGRLGIWGASLKVMFSSLRTFIFGVTPVNVPSLIKQYGGFSTEFAHAHNQILQIGICFGVPAMVLYIAFLVSIAIKCLRILLSQRGRDFRGAYSIPVAILMLVTLDMAESFLVAYFSIMGCVFFLFCGWVCAIDRDKGHP